LSTGTTPPTSPLVGLIAASMPSGVEHIALQGRYAPSRGSDRRLDAFGR